MSEPRHAYYLEHIAHTDSGRRDTRHRDEALAILEEVGHLVRLSSLQNNIGIEAYYDGRWDECAPAPGSPAPAPPQNAPPPNATVAAPAPLPASYVVVRHKPKRGGR